MQCEDYRAFCIFFATSLIISVKHVFPYSFHSFFIFGVQKCKIQHFVVKKVFGAVLSN